MLGIVRTNFFSVLFFGVISRISLADDTSLSVDTCVTEGYDLCSEYGKKCIAYLANKQENIAGCDLVREDLFPKKLSYSDERLFFDTKNVTLGNVASTTRAYSVYYGKIRGDLTLQENCCNLTENSGGCQMPAVDDRNNKLHYYVVYQYVNHTASYAKYCYQEVEWKDAEIVTDYCNNDSTNTPCLFYNSDGWYEARYEYKPTSPESEKMKLDACFFDLEQPHEITNDYALVPDKLTEMDANFIRTYSENTMTMSKVENKIYYCNPHTNINGSVRKTFIDDYAKNGTELVCYSLKYPGYEVYYEKAICILFSKPAGNNFVMIGVSVGAILALIALVVGVKMLREYRKAQKSKGDVRIMDQTLGESFHAEKTPKNKSDTEDCDVFIPGEIDESAPDPVFVNNGKATGKAGDNQDNLSDVITPDVYIMKNPGPLEQNPGEGTITDELICDTNVQGQYCPKENATMMPENPGFDSGMNDGYTEKHIDFTVNGKYKGSGSSDELDSGIGDTSLRSGYTPKYIMKTIDC